MVILGINQVPSQISWQHDSSAALVKDGKLIAMIEEERLNRQRHARGYPRQAVDFCLKTAGVTLQDVDVIAVGYNPWRFLSLRYLNLRPSNFFKDLLNLVLFTGYLSQLKKQSGAKIMYIDHHTAHAASTYRCSGFTDANILTMDGSGEVESFACFSGSNGVIKKLWDIPLGGRFAKKKDNSIGLLYTRLTHFLSLGNHGEGKLMGLASYGKPVFDFSTILQIKNHKNYIINRANIAALYGEYERTDTKTPLTQEHKDLAASLQDALESSIVNLSAEAHAATGFKNFCFAGGVALNCNTNTKVLEQDFCDDLFVQPAANDGGISLGAALEAAARLGEPADFRMEHAYWGPEFSNEEIKQVLDDALAVYEYHENIEAVTAKEVTEGNIVGWFQGRMEIGPRALGARTILADPTHPGIADKVNERVKHREVWRPFAPSVAEEASTTYFKTVDKLNGKSPFMLHVFYVKDAFKNTFPAITHVDGSSRIQTVNEQQHPRYYKLIKEIEKINGHPIVLDTSFNDAGEPIVCTPKDAIRCFYATGFDSLAIGNFLVRKQK